MPPAQNYQNLSALLADPERLSHAFARLRAIFIKVRVIIPSRPFSLARPTRTSPGWAQARVRFVHDVAIDANLLSFAPETLPSRFCLRPGPFAQARSTRATDVPLLDVEARVLRVVRMALRAVRLRGMTLSRLLPRGAPRGVLSWSDRIQVGGIDATPISAEVIEVQSGRNRRDEFLVDGPVSPNRLPFTVDASVAIDSGPHPFPTARIVSNSNLVAPPRREIVHTAILPRRAL